ncbi:MAG TPA: hypothetical protein VEA38_11650 [Terriglobales bacterium]|nr:hypothetical protein [Terriglobales bacterium]
MLAARKLPELGERGAALTWPVQSRRVTVTDLNTTTGTRYSLGCPHGYVVTLGSFKDVEISPDGDNWYPASHGSVWPLIPPPGGSGKRAGRTTASVRLRRGANGGGTVVLAAYREEAAARVAAGLASGSNVPGKDPSQPGSFFTDRVTLAAAAVQYVAQSDTLYITVKKDGGTGGQAFIAETEAKANAVDDRYALDPGEAIDLYTPSFWHVGTVGEFLYIVEHRQ